MKLLSRSESAIENDKPIETPRIARPIANQEPEVDLKLRSTANVPTEQSDYSLRDATVWVLIAVLVVLSCGALYALWSKAL
jgi:hypothetical protein